VPIELEYHLYYDNADRMVARPMYTARLIALANKYAPGHEKLMKGITEIDFRQSDLENFVNEINNTGQQP
jgi:hypothetical protein